MSSVFKIFGWALLIAEQQIRSSGVGKAVRAIRVDLTQYEYI